MAVSSRTVGLAELFAMAAEQPASDGATVQRLGTSPESSTAETSPSGTSSFSLPATPTETTIQTTLAEGAAPMPAPTTSATPATPSAADLEEMARRLYEPMAARIRAELWQDRERAGLLTDLRP